jgi:arylsulfatase A-like enzyme
MNYKYYLFVLIILVFSCKSENQKEPVNDIKPPNILFILVDDLGILDLSFTGSEYYETPNIDKLAKKSTVFTQGYANSRVCSPSRASIMLGQSAPRHGITDWIGAKTGEDWRNTKRHDKMLPAEYKHHMNAEDTTLSEAFKQNGYTTFFAGKWHLGDVGNEPEDHGFDINKGGWESGSPKGGYFSPYINPKLENKEDGEQLSFRLAKETANFMEQHQDSTFFAFLSFYAVHGPIQTQQEKWAKYRAKAEEQGIAENGFTMEKNLPIRLHQDNPVYAGLVENMDDAVGLVLDELERLNLDKNTIVVFTSDNGGVTSGDNFSSSMAPYRGGKGYQWEGGIREPYFIYVPNQAAKEVDTPVAGADLYPTLLDLANLELLPNQHKDGVSLKPLIEGTSTFEERALYWHYPHYGNQGGDPSSIIREGDWKLIHYYEEDTQQLFNLAEDPYEQKDMASVETERAQQMHQQLMKYLNEVGAKFPEFDPEFDAEKRANYMKNVEDKRMKNLEKQRQEMLSEDFQPNEDWWGSKTTID